ncbi:hypothetical protein [Synechococcus phage BUCT-ZZ01]|nr:hypothetical protein [Synechococcus phage BUCT-ZZ01]
MAGTNDITGDTLVSKIPSTQYKDNWDTIFICNNESADKKCKNCDCWKNQDVNQPN